jgi:hypothetical protein
MAYYNLGNTFFKSNKLQESLQAYKHTLRLSPADEDARYNYLLAKDRLKQQQDQKKQDQQNKRDQNQQNKQDQQKQDQQQNNQQNQGQQQQQPQPQQAKPDQTSQQQKNQMPKQQADRILEALRNNEKEIQKQIRKRAAARVIIEKDW